MASGVAGTLQCANLTPVRSVYLHYPRTYRGERTPKIARRAGDAVLHLQNYVCIAFCMSHPVPTRTKS